MSMETLIAVSNRYGVDTEYVIAGGGNTSWKTEEFMYVKGSGTELATITEDGFVKVDLKKLDNIWSKSYSQDSDVREEEVLVDLMESRFPGQKEKRPSVETLLHALLPYKYVVHTHPALINALTCSIEGEQAVAKMFGDKAIWIPVTNPGYILSKEVKDKIDGHVKSGKEYPEMIFLQNHGVFVYGHNIEEIDKVYDSIIKSIKDHVTKFPDVNQIHINRADADRVAQIIKETIEGVEVTAFANSDILSLIKTEETFAPLKLSLTPDHIVYYGFKPVYSSSLDNLKENLIHFVKENGSNPRLVVISGIGAFAFNSTMSLANKAKQLFIDDVKIVVYCESFGGVQFMPKDKIDFIRNWEVEKYRFSQSK
ncbi:MAG: class II aldolase/adducin family protein [Spirochaetaceae bacterium]